MRYENRSDLEYHRSDYEYRIPSDDLKRPDHEFCSGQTLKEEKGERPDQKKKKRLSLMVSVLTVAAITSFLSDGSSNREPVYEETVTEAFQQETVSMENERESAAETLPAQAENGILLTEDERGYLDRLSNALKNREFEQVKELIDGPDIKEIYNRRYQDEQYIYADGRLYIRDTYTGVGLHIEVDENNGRTLGFQSAAWIQVKNGVASGEGIYQEHIFFNENSHAYTQYDGMFKDNWANGHGRYLDEYFDGGASTNRDEAEGTFRNGQLYTGSARSYGEHEGQWFETSYTVQNERIIKAIERGSDMEAMVMTAEDYTDDSVFSLNDIFVGD